MPAPRPLPCLPIRDPELAATVRRLDCAHYDRCLAIAERGHWPSFTCGTALCYQPPSEKQRAHDNICLLRLGKKIVEGLDGGDD